MERIRRTPNVLLVLNGLAGVVALAVLLLSPPLRIGEGGFEGFVRALEQHDFRGELVTLVILLWLLPSVLLLLWRQGRVLGLENDRIRALLADVLRDRSIPVKVDVNARIPVKFEEPLQVPMELHTRVSVDEEIDIEAEVPVQAEIPLDVEVEAQLLRFGVVRLPITGTIPVNVVVPVKGRVRVRAAGIPVDLVEKVRVMLPPVEIPVVSRIDTKIDLLANLRAEPGATVPVGAEPVTAAPGAAEVEPGRTNTDAA